jgi:hypothetical protein
MIAQGIGKISVLAGACWATAMPLAQEAAHSDSQTIWWMMGLLSALVCALVVGSVNLVLKRIDKMDGKLEETRNGVNELKTSRALHSNRIDQIERRLDQARGS